MTTPFYRSQWTADYSRLICNDCGIEYEPPPDIEPIGGPQPHPWEVLCRDCWDKEKALLNG